MDMMGTPQTARPRQGHADFPTEFVIGIGNDGEIGEKSTHTKHHALLAWQIPESMVDVSSDHSFVEAAESPGAQGVEGGLPAWKVLSSLHCQDRQALSVAVPFLCRYGSAFKQVLGLYLRQMFNMQVKPESIMEQTCQDMDLRMSFWFFYRSIGLAELTDLFESLQCGSRRGALCT